MAIQRYEVDPLDGEYRCDSGNWVQYEDHLAEVALLVGQMAKLLASLEQTVDNCLIEDECFICRDDRKLIAEIRDSMIQSTHGKETDGPAVSN